jgi:predicted transcriptional regulator
VSGVIHVTEAEHALLEVLWRRGPLTPPRLMHEVQEGRAWSASTIKTLLARLIRKGAIRTEREAGRLQYRALLDREAYVAAEVQALADRMFGGDLQALGRYLMH